MERSAFFNSVNGDRKYKAEDFARYFASFIGNGVFPNPSTNLQVLENGNVMSVVVSSGKAWINGYFYENTNDLVLPIEVADGVLPRIDRVVLRWDVVNREIRAKVKKGTYASNPTPPDVQRDADVYELALADVYVAAGAIGITQANITDQRLNTELCGIVHAVVDQVDTATIFNQYLSWFQTFRVEKQADFEAWLQTLKDVLDENTAGNLLNMIQDLAGAGRTTETVKGIADALATHLADYVKHPSFAIATGTNNYNVTLNPAPSSYIDGMGIVVAIPNNATGNCTLNVNGLGAKPIKKANGNNVTNLKANGIYTLRYNSNSDSFILQGEGGEYGTALAEHVLEGYTIGTENGIVTGTMPNRGTFNLPLGARVPAGYYSGGSVPNGKRFNVRTAFASTSSPLTVTGLGFTPSMVLFVGEGGGPTWILVSHSNTRAYHLGSSTTTDASITSDGYTFSGDSFYRNYTITAIE